MGCLLPDYGLAIRDIEHPFRERGGGVIRQQHLHCARRLPSRQYPNLLPGMGVVRVVHAHNA